MRYRERRRVAPSEREPGTLHNFFKFVHEAVRKLTTTQHTAIVQRKKEREEQRRVALLVYTAVTVLV